MATTIDVSVTKSSVVSIGPPAAKRAAKFTCMGWVKNPVFPGTDPITLLAIAGYEDDEFFSEKAINVDLAVDGADFRLQFSHSKSKKIAQASGIFLNDEEFHLLTYICDGNGSMRYYVDAVEIPPEDGFGEGGIAFSTAWSRQSRVGGGDVCVPCLRYPGQSITVYNWRYGVGFTLHQAWIRELMEQDLLILSPAEEPVTS